MDNLKILCIGPMWRGSNAGGLFRALSRLGLQIAVVDEFYHIPLLSKGYGLRFVSKFFRHFFVKEYNIEIIRVVDSFIPDLVLVYKGAFVLPKTLNYIKQKAVLLINFYPDVSFHTHGKFLKKTLPLYDHIFTTKSFGIRDFDYQLGFKNSSYIPHGFDPDIHRPLIEANKKYKYDVSFIGTWSPDKEKKLAVIKESIPDTNLVIFGNQWEKSHKECLKKSIMGYPITGDQYVEAIQQSRINLGLLSEKVRGASSGDQITSRTFHIPACRGFMLHQKTDELLENYIEDEEVVCFSNESELVEKVNYYLKNEERRNSIVRKGYERAMLDHSMDNRARKILNFIQNGL